MPKTDVQHILVPIFLLLFLYSQVQASPTDNFRPYDRARRSDASGKPVYLFLKLWSPPILHYHESARPKTTRKFKEPLSPFAFYHTYGKRNGPCSDVRHKTGGEMSENPPQSRIPVPMRQYRRSMSEDSDW